MSTLLGFLCLISLGVLAVALIKPSLFRQPSRKRAGLVFGGITLVVFAITGIFSPSTPTASTTATTEQPSATSAPQTDQQKLEANLASVIGNRAGSTDVSYKGIEIDSESSDPSRPKGAQMLTIQVNVGSFYDKNAFVRDTGDLSAKLFQAAFPSYLAPYDVVVQYFGKTTDRYGNENNKAVIVYSTDKPTFGKINWQNFDSSKLCDFLNQQMQIDGTNSGSICNILANIQ